MADDWPGMRRSERHGKRRRSAAGPGTAGSGTGYRQQRRASERRRRRGRTLWLVVGLVAVCALVVGGVLLAPRLFSGSSSTVTTAPAPVASAMGGVVLLRLVEGQNAPVVVMVAPDNDPGAIVGLPGDTLVQGDKGFEQLDDLLVSQGIAGTSGPTEAIVGLRPGAAAAASWVDVRAALVAAGVTQTYDASLGAGGTATAEEGAQALAALAATLQTDKGRAALAALPLTGDGEVVRTALRTIGAGVKVVAGLPGREVEGTGFTYYEADARAVRELLGEKEATSGVSVEVQNGSGAVDVAERAVAVIRPRGFTMLPIRNADDFPDVQITQVLAGAASLEAADQVRAAIGAGKVIRQDSLGPGQVVVIVGSDLTLAALEKAAATSTTTTTARTG